MSSNKLSESDVKRKEILKECFQLKNRSPGISSTAICGNAIRFTESKLKCDIINGSVHSSEGIGSEYSSDGCGDLDYHGSSTRSRRKQLTPKRIKCTSESQSCKQERPKVINGSRGMAWLSAPQKRQLERNCIIAKESEARKGRLPFRHTDRRSNARRVGQVISRPLHASSEKKPLAIAQETVPDYILQQISKVTDDKSQVKLGRLQYALNLTETERKENVKRALQNLLPSPAGISPHLEDPSLLQILMAAKMSAKDEITALSENGETSLKSTCGVCSQVYSERHLFIQHQSANVMNKCSLCGDWFNTQCAFDSHMQHKCPLRVRNTLQKRQLESAAEDTADNSKVKRNRTGPATRFRRILPRRIVSETATAKTISDVKLYTTAKSSGDQAIPRVCKKQELCTYFCTFCSSLFGNAELLAHHICSCLLCKSVMRRAHVDRHFLDRHQQNLCKCTECNLVFAFEDHLMIHISKVHAK